MNNQDINSILITTQSLYYPCHLSWEEINNPNLVIEHFFNRWDLLQCRLKLKKYEHLLCTSSFSPANPDHSEIKAFFNELERLAEAVYVINLQVTSAGAAPLK